MKLFNIILPLSANFSMPPFHQDFSTTISYTYPIPLIYDKYLVQLVLLNFIHLSHPSYIRQISCPTRPPQFHTLIPSLLYMTNILSNSSSSISYTYPIPLIYDKYLAQLVLLNFINQTKINLIG